MFLYQPTSGYCYNSDSIFLYDFIASLKPKGDLLDVGCGVGIISLLLSRDFRLNTTIVEKQKSMLDYAEHNYRLNHLEARSYFGDFLTLKIEKKFDYIVSNPPFYDDGSVQSKNEHLNIARYACHLPIGDFFKKVKQLLKPRGYFVFCYDAKQLERLLFELKTLHVTPEKIQFVHSKMSKEAKLVMIVARNNSKSLVKILPPFVVFDEESHYLKKAQMAFKKANTNSIKGDF